MTVRLLSQGIRKYVYMTGCVMVLFVSQALAGIQITTAEEVLQNTGNTLQQAMPNMDFLFVNRQVSTTTGSRVDDDDDDDYTSNDSSYGNRASDDWSGSNNNDWGGSNNNDWGGSNNNDWGSSNNNDWGSSNNNDWGSSNNNDWGTSNSDYGWR